MIENVNIKANLSFIGAMVHYISISSVYSLAYHYPMYIVSYYYWDEFSPYANSYIGFFITAIIIAGQAIFNPLGEFIAFKWGVHIPLCLGGTLLTITNAVFYYVPLHFNTMLLVMAFYGLGLGLCSTAPIRNACRYYPPELKGAYALYIITAGEVSKAFYSFIGESLIKAVNPSFNGHPHPYYIDKEETSKVFGYVLFMFFWIPILTIISLFLIYQYKPCYATSLFTATTPIPKQKANTPTLSKIIWNRKVLFYFMVCFCIHFQYLMTESTYKLGAVLNSQVTVIHWKYLTGSTCLCVAIAGPLWGLCYRTCGNRLNMIVFATITFILCLVDFWTIFDTWAYSGFVIGIHIILVGLRTHANLHMIKVFSFDYSHIVMAVINIGQAMATAFGCYIVFYFRSPIGKGSEIQTFVGSYLISPAISIVGFVLVFYEKNEEYNYDYDHERDEPIRTITPIHNDESIGENLLIIKTDN